MMLPMTCVSTLLSQHLYDLCPSAECVRIEYGGLQ